MGLRRRLKVERLQTSLFVSVRIIEPTAQQVERGTNVGGVSRADMGPNAPRRNGSKRRTRAPCLGLQPHLWVDSSHAVRQPQPRSGVNDEMVSATNTGRQLVFCRQPSGVGCKQTKRCALRRCIPCRESRTHTRPGRTLCSDGGRRRRSNCQTWCRMTQWHNCQPRCWAASTFAPSAGARASSAKDLRHVRPPQLIQGASTTCAC